MLSILIPTYNYNAYPLAQELEKQALALGITFELICMDDGSFSVLNEENQKINALAHCSFIENKKNLGAIGCRKSLAKIAQYSWLLFLDADVMPAKTNFLAINLQALSQNPDVVFGGIAYRETPTENSKTLRYTYGLKREQKSMEKRSKKPYTSFISGCFLIRKDLFLDVIKNLDVNSYGLDILISFKLKTSIARMLHIDNPVYHLGLDSNEDYLKKSKKALDVLFLLNQKRLIPPQYSPLLSYCSFLNRLGLKTLFGKIIGTFTTSIEKNLTGNKPNLILFDLYRLGYLCRIKP